MREEIEACVLMMLSKAYLLRQQHYTVFILFFSFHRVPQHLALFCFCVVRKREEIGKIKVYLSVRRKETIFLTFLYFLLRQ